VSFALQKTMDDLQETLYQSAEECATFSLYRLTNYQSWFVEIFEPSKEKSGRPAYARLF
jgi:hypothetical protein